MDDMIHVSGSRGTKDESGPAASDPSDANGVTAKDLGESEITDPAADAIESEQVAAGQDRTEDQIMPAANAMKKRATTKRDSAAAAEYKPRYSTPTRRPADKRPASFSPVAWMADGISGAIEEARHNDLGLSKDFWTHLYAVRRESLLTARALVESLIAMVESKGDEQEEREQRRERRGSVIIDF